jgi:ketosteroid isomerase-like protein
MVTMASRPVLRSTLSAVVLASVLAVSIAPRASAQAEPAAADLAAIAEFNRRYLGAINDGDIDTLAALTTEGHMMIASGGPPLTGKKALVDAMARAFQTTDFDESWTPQETVVSGDLAYQRGTFVVVSRPKAGGAESRIAGNFLRIYRKIGGAWFMVRDSFNSQQPRNGQ